MKNSKLLIVLLSVLLVSLSGCADTVTFTQAANTTPVGFWHGLWHGITFPFAWVGSVFVDSISVYAIYNNGGFYDFGFFLGTGAFGATALNN